MKKLFTAIFCMTLVLSGCTEATNNGSDTRQNDPNRKTLGSLSYSLGEIKDVNVNITFENPEKLWTAEGLQAAAKECGTEQPLEHYQSLLGKFERSTIQVYHFTPKNNPDEVYDVMLVPNKPGYASLEESKKDFDVCAAGGMYPAQTGKAYLLFTGSCGGALDSAQTGSTAQDGTQEKTVSCSDIQQTVDPSLKLVE
jgi:hypothetical protein